MNKQEALEAILTRCRLYENGAGEQVEPFAAVMREMRRAMSSAVTTESSDVRRSALVTLGAGVVFMLMQEEVEA